jgi:HlyD family secretion protein
MSGTITSLNVKSGETAIVGTMNRAQGVLMSIGDLTGLMTVVTVGEADVSRIEVGDSAVVQMDAFIDTTFVGRVTQISSRSILGASAAAGSAPAVDYEVTIEILNAPRETRIDFSTSAKIVVEQRTQTLAVPIVALTVREHETIPDEDSVPALAASKAAREIGRVDVEGVFLIGEDNKVTFRPVKVGIAGERYFEVLQGLSGGERIVAGTYQAIRGLRDSMMVRPAENDTLKTKGG